MSKFIKALEELSRGNARPLGFSGKASARQAPMMLVAQLTQADAEMAKSAVSAKADALLFMVKDAGDIDALSSISPSIEVPWGVRTSIADAEQINKLPGLGCDYLVFNWELPARCIGDEKLGRILEVEASLDNTSARAIGQLSLVDAICIAGEGKSKAVTVKDLANYRRMTGFAGMSALASVPASVEDLGVLLEAGVRAVVADVSAGRPAETLTEVREAIDKLPLSRPGSRRGISATVPMMSSVEVEEEEEEEEM